MVGIHIRAKSAEDSKAGTIKVFIPASPQHTTSSSNICKFSCYIAAMIYMDCAEELSK
jgi:hypothetical protein